MNYKKGLPSLFFLTWAFLGSFPISAKAEALQLSPVVFHVLANPLSPVQGSDGEYHLVYEIQASNVSPRPWQVDGLKVLGDGKVLAELTGAELKARMGPLSSRGGSDELVPNQTAIIWLHLKFSSKKAIPEKFHHQLTITGSGKTMEIAGAEALVSSEQPLVLGSPLKGDDWLAGDGCCDSSLHVRALLPINGSLYAAQRFAIDWEKINQDKKIYSGDPKNPENYFCYGQDVFAVANGVVVERLDGLPNQVPGKLPDGMDLAHADGNHVILLLSPGHYALYAHLKPGSLRVKVGDRVREGQVLAQVGNTGNTSEPHLHFHMMDGPSPLTSNGLPYVLKSFEILGKAVSTAAFNKAAADGSPMATQAEKSPSPHKDELPLDLSLVRFP